MALRSTRTRALLTGLAITVSLGGCGLGRSPAGTTVSLVVTRGFGEQRLGTRSDRHPPGSETVLRLLERDFTVRTAPGGGSVQAIGGHTAQRARSAWSYYVNGVAGPRSLKRAPVHGGDRIWWDLHDAQAAGTIPAVVGSYPAPFSTGVAGKRLPTTLECGHGMDLACTRVSAALGAAHVPVARQLIGTGSGPDTLGIVVGTWEEIRGQLGAELIAHGPSGSGVYARFTPTGAGLALLDARGRAARTLTGDAGLVAATADTTSAPTWLITGTDAAGVAAAASALTPSALRDHFALAVQGGSRIPVPVPVRP